MGHMISGRSMLTSDMRLLSRVPVKHISRRIIAIHVIKKRGVWAMASRNLQSRLLILRRASGRSVLKRNSNGYRFQWTEWYIRVALGRDSRGHVKRSYRKVGHLLIRAIRPTSPTRQPIQFLHIECGDIYR